MPSPGGTTDRGYGHDHQTHRRYWARILKQHGTVPCHAQEHTQNCDDQGNLVHHGEAWDLGHDDARTAWTGPEHPSCNRRNGALRAHQGRSEGPTAWGW